ncbi:MAG: hypothetical protein AAGA75_00380 [Cyanobacteria bacterium P01_E01_bin.6]
MAELSFPFLDLFQQLQGAGMKLSPEQYDLLRQAIGKGFGQEDWKWDELRQVCRVLWVKPSRNYDGQTFEQVFDQYVRQKQEEIRAQLTVTQPEAKTAPPKPAQPMRQWPRVPPRKKSVSQPEATTAEEKVPTAFKTGVEGLPQMDDPRFKVTPRQMPLPQRTILDSWQLLRRPLREGIRTELDLPATIRCISQVGYFSDVVMRPVKNKRAELIVLVDDGNVMLPYQPALQPLVRAIETQQITPAKLYRFTTYPDEYLYDWVQPSHAIPLDQVLAQMHARRTIVLVWGDAGVTQTNPADAHRKGLLDFLNRLCPCVRSLIWLNPLPPYRWTGTLAEEVAYWLDGRMTHLNVFQVLTLAKKPAGNDRIFLRSPG